MRKLYLFILIYTFCITRGTGQGVVVSNSSSTPDPSAMLDVQSISKGLLIPRMTQSQRIGIINSAKGLLVFQTDGLSGFYYNTGSASTPTWIVLSSAVTGGWSVNGTAIYYNSGRVGIGISNPESILHLAEENTTLDGTSGTFLTIQNNYNSGNTGFMSGIRFRTDGANILASDKRYKSAIFHRKTNLFGVGDLHFAVNNEANDNSATFVDTRMTIQSSGRVGIGITSPESILHLAEVNTTLDGSSGTFLTIQNNYNSGNTGFMSGIRFRTDGVNVLASDKRYKSAIFHRKTNAFGVGSLHFAVNNEFNDNSATFADTRMTIASNGYVGIGTTTPNAPLTFPNNVSKKITLYPGLTGDVGLAVAGNDFRIYSDNVNARISFGYDDYVNGFISRAYVPAAGSTAMVVQGNLQVNSTTYTSDIRYKTNIQNIENGLNKILNLRGVTYLMRKEEFPQMSFDNKSQMGLIAQEVELVVPEVVTTSNTGYKSVDYARLIPILIEGIKEQQQQIEELKIEKDKKINELMKEIELIKNKLK